MSERSIHNGDFLIADPFLKDNSFMRSVVLICDVNEAGASGFIINKKVQQSLGELIKEMAGIDFPVFYGGPVKMDTLHFVHTRPDLLPDGFQIKKDVYWGGDFDRALALIQDGVITSNELRLYLGQSSWSENQLGQEVREKTWLVAPGKKKLLFYPSSKTAIVWKESVKLLGKEFAPIANYPLDPTLN